MQKILGSPLAGVLKWPYWPTLGHAATVIGVLVAAYQLRASAHDTREQLLLQREIAANASWERHMELQAANPRFARGADFARLGEDDRWAYRSYVERMLFAGEQVLVFSPDDGEWALAVRSEARRHPTYIGSPAFLATDYCSYTRQLRLQLVGAFAHDPPLSARIAAAHKRCLRRGFVE